MKRLLVITLVVCMVLGAGIMATGVTPVTADRTINWNVGSWIRIYLHVPTVDLGIVDATNFTRAGVGIPIVSPWRSARVAGNVAFTLRLTAALTVAPATGLEGLLTRFKVRGGAIDDFTTIPAAPAAGLVMKTTTTGAFYLIGVHYQFTPHVADPPGDYVVTVTYTVTAP